MEADPIFSEDALLGGTTRILEAAGVPSPKAQLVAESLVSASLRGVDSHGVQLLPYYVAQLRAGNIAPAEDGVVLSESGACMIYDGRRGLGQKIADACCAHAIRLAREHGLGTVVSCNSNHFGAAAFWGQRIAAQGMIGLVLCNASPSVAPWQGREGRIGTNPICMAVPSTGSGAWLLDMATTTVAMNKIIQASANGQRSIPAGWALDFQGVPTTDTQTAMRGLLMPLGGYKGSGLGLMVEILCGVLSGGAMSGDVGGLHILTRPMATSQFFLAVDIQRFLAPEVFQQRMEQLIAAAKSSAPAWGYDEVMVAGDPEWRSQARRTAQGIPLKAAALERINTTARELGVPGLEPLSLSS
jgi:LDH2 family malate/lactate/ureidoglycolate dehydrogenase